MPTREYVDYSVSATRVAVVDEDVLVADTDMVGVVVVDGEVVGPLGGSLSADRTTWTRVLVAGCSYAGQQVAGVNMRTKKVRPDLIYRAGHTFTVWLS